MKSQKFLFLHPLPNFQRGFFYYRKAVFGLNHGLGIMAQMTLDRGHKVTVLPYYKLKNLKRALSYNYDWIFITTFTNQFPLICKSLRLIKKQAPKAKVVLGGVHASFAPKSFHRYPYDILVRGEGEIFLNKLLDNEDMFALPGVYGKGQEIKKDFVPIARDLDTLPPPLRYQSPRTVALRFEVLGTRGCVFKCPYCSNSLFKKIYPGYLRRRSPANIIEEIVYNKKNYTTVHFLDDDIFTDRAWLEELLDLYKKNVEIPYSVKARPLIVNQELLTLLKSTGCFRINMGIEHGNYNTRKNYLGRIETDEQIVEAFLLAKSMNFQTLSYNIMGMPDDTEHDIIKLIELNKKAKPTFTFYTLFQPYPGTRMNAYAKEKGIKYKFPDSYFRWSRKQLNTLPDLPGISREKLIYYFQNFTRLAGIDSPFKLWTRSLIRKILYNTNY